METVRSLPEPFGSMVSTLIEVCAYAGTGNVLKIQKLLHLCSEHYETNDNKDRKKVGGRFWNVVCLTCLPCGLVANSACSLVILQTGAKDAKKVSRLLFSLSSIHAVTQ